MSSHLSFFKTSSLLGLICFLGVSFVAPARAADLGGARPNIIFILADDLGYGDLGCYGQKKTQTPQLDKMAAEGIRFTSCYAGSTVCAPSRCSLMTGLHTGHARIRGNARYPLQPGDVTVAESLKEAGYRTALIGKWGLGEAGSTGAPNKKGFDYFFGYLNQRHAHNYYPSFLWRNEEKAPLRNQVPNEDSEGSGIATVRLDYAPDLFAQEALQFVEQNKTRAFFLALTFITPHANNEAKAKGMEVPADEPYSTMDWPQPEKNKAAMITRMDRDIGRLFQKLKDLGLDRNTIVFFSSDNGPHREGGNDPRFFESSGPLRGIKRDLYEGGIRVPMIVRWPGKIKAGATSDQVWAFWDVLPTLAELAGAKSPKNLDGISMLPALMGGPQKSHEFLYWEFHEGGSKQGARMDHWKGVRLGPGSALELYNLEQDLGETKNIASDHPDIVAKLEAYLKGARSESEQWPIRANARARN
jgi:arylsulfatase A-like enzyme